MGLTWSVGGTATTADGGLSASPSSVREDAGADHGTVTAALGGRFPGGHGGDGVGGSGCGLRGERDGLPGGGDFPVTIAAGRDERHGRITAVDTAPASLAIEDGDTASTEVTLSASPMSVSEDAGAATVTVTAALDAAAFPADTVVTVSVGSGVDAAASGTDYEAVADLQITIAAGATSATGTFVLTPVDDGLAEGDEALSLGGSASGLTVAGAEVTITDDDVPSTEVTLSASPSSVSEDAGATTVTVTAALDAAAFPADTVVTVSVGSGGDSAASGTDYQSVADFEVTIGAGATSGTGTFTLTPMDDGLAEGDEALSLGGSASGLTVVGAEVTVTDDDTASTEVTLSASPSSVSEDAGAATMTVTAALDAAAFPVDTVVTVSVGSGADSAASGTDYQAVADFEVTIAAGATSGTGTFTLTPVDDGLAEGDEELSLGGSASGLTVAGAEVTITDDDTASTEVTLSASPSSVSEDAGATTVTVTAALDAAAFPADTPVTVSVGAGADSAASGTDYESVADFEVTILAGATSGTGTFTLTPVADDVDEEDEGLTLGGSVDGLRLSGTALTITDDDTRGVLVSPGTLEVDEGGEASYTVVLGSAPTGPVTVTASVVGSADVTVSPSSVRFTASDWSTAVPVTVTASEDDDGALDEARVSHEVTGGDYGSEGASDVLVTVRENESRMELRASLVPSRLTVEEGAGAAVTVRIEASRLPAERVEYRAFTHGGTAEAGSDYRALRPLIQEALRADFEAQGGVQVYERTFTVSTVDDAIDESNERFFFGLRNPVDPSETDYDSEVLGPSNGARVTIRDNDERGVEMTPRRLTVAEGGEATYTVVLGSRPTEPVGAMATVVGSPDVRLTPRQLVFQPNGWDEAQTVTVRASADADAELDEATIRYALLGGDYTGLEAPEVAVTVREAETASTEVALSASPSLVSEDAGAATVTVTAALDAGARTAATPVTVTVGAGADAAVEGTDYRTVADFTITIAAGATSGTGTFTLTPVDDALAEGDEELSLGGSASGLTVVGAEVTITDDDMASTEVTLSASPSSVSEDGGATTVTVTAALDAGARAVATPVTVTVGAGADAAVEGTDYQAVADFTITIAAGSTSGTGTFTLTPVDDGLAEGDEELSLGGSASGLTVVGAEVTITDDDSASTEVTLSASPSSVSEDAGATTVTVTAALDAGARAVATPVTVMVGAGADSAVEGTDYQTVSDLTITIAAGSTSGTGTFTLTPVDDALAEGDEELSLSGSASGLTVVGAPVTITDDETASTAVTLSASPSSVSEDAGATTVTVTAALDADARAEATPVTVTVGSGADSAVEGTDYQTVSDFTITIAAGATRGTGTFTLTPVDDALAEGDEELSLGGSASGLTVVGAPVTITDDDMASTEVTLSASPSSVREDAGATVVTVTAALDAGARAEATPVTVTVGSGADSAVEGTDYQSVSDLTITIAAGATSGTGTFTLTPVDDGLAEGDEDLSVSGSASGLTVVGASVTIRDDDRASTEVTLSVSPSSVREDGGAATVTVTAALDADARTVATPVTVTVGSGADSAVEGTDYQTVSDLTITIAAGATRGTGTFTLTPVDDALAEGDEELSLGGSASGLTVVGASVTITDDDSASTEVTLSASPSSVREDAGATVVTVTAALDADARAVATPVTVTVGAGADAAVEGTDYQTVSDLTITIAAGATSGTGTFTLTPMDDALAEGDEELSLGGSASGLTVVGAPVTITDDDMASTEVTLSASPSSVREDGGATVVTVTAALDADARTVATPVTVTVGAGADAAVEGTDYQSVSDLTITIAAGATSGTGTFTLTPMDDALAEGDEELSLGGSASGLTVVGAPVTITDDDSASTEVTLSASPSSVSEDAGATTVTVTAALDAGARAAATPVTVTVGSGADAAVEGTDYQSVSDLTITIAAGSTSGAGTFTLTPVDDALAEGDEELSLNGSASGLTVAGASVTITDDETASTEVTLSASPSSVSEDAGATVVTVTAALDADAFPADTVVTVSVGADAVAAAGGKGYQSVADFEVTISAGSTRGTGTFTLTPVDDALAEGDEELSLGGSASGLTVVGASVTIRDDDRASTEVTLSASPSSVREDAGATTVTVTAALDAGARTADTVVTVTVGAGADSAVEGTDYQTVSDLEITIAAGATSGTGTFTLTPVDDGLAEGNEDLSVSGSASGLTVAGASVTITDDDSPSTEVTLSASPSSVREDAGSTTVTVTAALDAGARAVATPVTVTVGAGADSAVEGTDYESVSDLTITIAAGATSGAGTFTLTPVDDGLAEGDEELSLGGSASGLTVAGAAVTITDDDSASTEVTLSASPSSVREDGGATTVTVTAALDAGARTAATPVTVTVGAGADSAVEGTDYQTVADFAITIAAGATSGAGTFTLTPVDDGLAEGDEELSLGGSASGLTVAGADVTIADDDTASTEVTLSASPSSVSEGAGATVVTVTAALDGGARVAATPVTVTVGSGADSAVEGADYESVSDFAITIAAGATSGAGTFTLTPVDDGLAEGDEELSLSGSASGLTVAGASVTIRDDDEGGNAIILSASPEEVMEDAGATGIEVTAALENGVRSAPTVVEVTLSRNDGAYRVAPESFEIEIPAGQASARKAFVLTPVSDTDAEADEHVLIRGAHPELAVTPARVVIRDDDAAAPETRRFTFRLAENRDGRRRSIFLGSVASDTSSGDARYVLAEGDARRFVVRPASGVLQYVGPGEDYETAPRQYELTIERIEAGVRSWAEVEVIVTDVPEAPVAEDDRVETAEDTALTIAVLANDHDPDGGRLQIASVGEPEHGVVREVPGGLRYTPEADWHGEDAFRYSVLDADGLRATATVRVTVTPVNDPPQARDDRVETAEDQPVWIAVLANDTDVDGDRLRVRSVGRPAHGTASLLEGEVVSYAPAANWHGVEDFRYTVSDPGGLESTATVTVTVRSVNDAPAAVGRIPDQSLAEGGEALSLEVGGYFVDVDGDGLAYTAVSSNEEAVTVSVSGGRLTLVPVVTGSATVTVTAADPAGLTATQSFVVVIGDARVREVMTGMLGALGRGYLSSARLTIGRRLEQGRSAGTRLLFGGRDLSPDGWRRLGQGGLEQSQELMFRALTLRSGVAAVGAAGTSSDPRLLQPAPRRGLGGGAGGRGVLAGDRGPDVLRRRRRSPRVDAVGPWRPAVVPGPPGVGGRV